MAFSRFSRFRGRSFGRVSRGFRPRNRLSNPQRTKGLEVATFFFEDSTALGNSSAFETQIYTVLASLPMSLGNSSSSPENRIGTALQSMNRYIQVNGIVYDYGIEAADRASDRSLAGDWYFCHQLFTDRIEYNASDVAFPATIGSYSPFETLFPVAVLTTTSPEFNQRQGVMPTRIHLSRTRHYDASMGQSEGDQTENTLYWPTGQKVDFREPTVNKRLRIRVDDNHGLFFGWFFRTGANFALPETDPRSIRRWARGQIYFRFRQ